MTPARAGTTFDSVPSPPVAPDDPRSRGDDLLTKARKLSSERMTPARAGTTRSDVEVVDECTDDPRLRGDDSSGEQG